jgi:hypothetical protein
MVLLIMAMAAGVAVVMSLAPQKLLRTEIPFVFFAPGMFKQSNAIVLAPAPVAVAILVP